MRGKSCTIWSPKAQEGIEPKDNTSTKKTRSSITTRWEIIKATKKSPKTKSLKKRTLPHVTIRWVPKTLLQAQGYYEGSTHL